MAEGDWTGREPGLTEEDLRQIAAERNGSHLSQRAGWWYFVRKNENGRFYLDKLEGWKAQEARARAARQPIEWYKPTPADLASINAFIARCRENDLSQTEFNDLVKRTGGAPLP